MTALALTIAVATQTHAEKQILLEYFASTMHEGIGGVSVDGEYVYAVRPTGLLILKTSGDSTFELVKDVDLMPGGHRREF